MHFVFFAFLFALFIAVFAIQNYLPVTVAFFTWNFQTSLVIVILGSATFGAMIVLFLSLLIQFRLRHSLNKERQYTCELKAENSTLKKRLEEQTINNMTKNEL